VRDIALGISQGEKIGDFDASGAWLAKLMERKYF